MAFNSNSEATHSLKIWSQLCLKSLVSQKGIYLVLKLVCPYCHTKPREPQVTQRLYFVLFSFSVFYKVFCFVCFILFLSSRQGLCSSGWLASHNLLGLVSWSTELTGTLYCTWPKDFSNLHCDQSQPPKVQIQGGELPVGWLRTEMPVSFLPA